MNQKLSEFLIDSFIKYSTISSQSNKNIQTLPSSEGQMKLAQELQKDLKELGLTEVTLEDNAILTAKIIGNITAPAILFMAHTDTVDIGASPDVKAQLIKFEGHDIVLNKEQNIIFKTEEHPEIFEYEGEYIIFSDGTSVLGADDKAGVTVLMGIAKQLMQNPMNHGDIYLVFVPDEEVGLRGAYALDLKKIPVDLAYTVDGGPIGEFGYETFNGAEVSLHIKGVSIHPGAGKDILVNPILVADDIISRMDRLDTPEHSNNKQGFFLVHEIKGNASDAHIEIIIRDFDLKKFNERKTYIQTIVNEVQALHPRAEILCEISDSYANIANNLSEDRTCVDIVKQAMHNLNIPIHIHPVRGGTDGSVLSSKGLVTPNIFTGAHDIHSVFEYLPVNSLYQSLNTVLEIIRLSALKK